MLYDEGRDESIEEPVFNPSSGGKSDIFDDCEKKNRDSSNFSDIGDRFELHMNNPTNHRSPMGFFDE